MKSDKTNNTVHPDAHATFRAEPFSRVSSNEWYQAGLGEQDRAVTRKAFAADESLRKPDITYTKVGTLDYRSLEKTYSDLLEEALVAGDNIFYEQVARRLAELYRHKEVSRLVGSFAINEHFVDLQHALKDQIGEAEAANDIKSYDTAVAKLVDLRAAKSVLSRNGGEARDKALSTERAERMNEELFGELEQHDFEVALAPYIKKARSLVGALPEARDLLERVGDDWNQDPGDFDFAMKPETLAFLKEDLFTIFPRLEETLAPHEARKATTAEATELANKVFETIGMAEKGWKAVLVAGTKSAETKVREKTIEFSEGKADYASTTAMNETVVHEAIGHAWRAEQSFGQDNPSLRMKMPGTDDFEESFATALQQLISQKPRIAGQRFVLAYGLSKGMDRGGVPRDFRDAHEILKDMLVIDNVAAGKDPGVDAAEQKAYLEGNRIRRGGALDARDLSYFLGCKKSYVWMNEIALLPAEERQAKLRWILSGRFDPTDKTQAELFS